LRLDAKNSRDRLKSPPKWCFCVGHVESTGEKREADRSFTDELENKQKKYAQSKGKGTP
jgi:hypothetical protein